MKQYVSVFMLTLRNVRTQLIVILAAMAAAEGVLFALAARNYLWIEDIIDTGRISWVFYLAVMALTVVFCRAMAGRSHLQYTIQRLAVSGREVFFLHVLANGLCYLLLWTVQLWIALLLCKIHIAVQPDSAGFSEQSVFLAFYRSEFLHGLFPLEDLSRWLRLLMMMAGLAVTSAYGACLLPQGKLSWQPYVIAALFIVFFEMEIGSMAADFILAAVAFLFIICIHLALPASGPYSDIAEPRRESEFPAPSPDELEVMR